MTSTRLVLSLILGLVLILPGCSDDDNPANAGQNEFDNQVVFAYAEGGSPAFGADYAVCCGDWDGEASRPAVKILIYDAEGEDGGWKIFLSRDEITAGETYELPAASAGQTPDLLIFAIDPDSGNELSSGAQGASGSITVEEMDCGSPLRVRITFTDVVVPSEFHDGPSVEVSGTLDAVIYKNPTDIGCGFGI